MISGVEVTCVQTCQAAVSFLARTTPSCIIVDLVVPQGGWRNEEVLGLPGLAFAEHVLAARGAESPDVVIYSVCVSDTLRKVARDIGVTAVYDKRGVSFPELLARLAPESTPNRRV
jgi:DNA-binding response OmpR family regulator